MDGELGATELAAVLKLQNAWRQQQGRRLLQQRRFELAKASAMTSAATRVQAVFRKRHTASNVIQLKAARKMQKSCRAHIRNRQLDAAVVKIQAGWRGYAVRRSTKSPNGKAFVAWD